MENSRAEFGRAGQGRGWRPAKTGKQGRAGQGKHSERGRARQRLSGKRAVTVRDRQASTHRLGGWLVGWLAEPGEGRAGQGRPERAETQSEKITNWIRWAGLGWAGLTGFQDRQAERPATATATATAAATAEVEKRLPG